MPLKLPKLPDTRAVHIAVMVLKYALFVAALAAAGSFLPRFLRSKIRVSEENRSMRPAIGGGAFFDLERGPCLAEGDALVGILEKTVPGRKLYGRVLHRGDVVVLGEDKRGERLLARVVALPGDVVETGPTGQINVNGKSELVNYRSGYASTEELEKTRNIFTTVGTLLVPRGHIFCLTDRRGTQENKDLGLTSLREVRGKLILGPRDRAPREE